jgi:hypothetical protein
VDVDAQRRRDLPVARALGPRRAGLIGELQIKQDDVEVQGLGLLLRRGDEV